MQYQEKVLHAPPLSENVAKLVKGQTRKTDVFKWFGIPDLQADGSKITLFPESTMGQYRARCWDTMREFYREIGDSNKKQGSGDYQPAETNIYEEIAAMQAYSSIDDELIALLYREIYNTSKGQTTERLTTNQVRCYSNSLLIFIEKRTGIVTEFSYREEFKPD